MKLIIYITFITICFSCYCIHAESDLKAHSLVDNNDIYFFITNIGESKLIINKRFSIGTSNYNEVIVTISDDKDNIIEEVFLSRLQAALKEKYSYELGPGEVIGTLIEKTRLKRVFNLMPGEYTVQLAYNNYFRSEEASTKVYSTPVVVIIE